MHIFKAEERKQLKKILQGDQIIIGMSKICDIIINKSWN